MAEGYFAIKERQELQEELEELKRKRQEMKTYLDDLRIGPQHDGVVCNIREQFYCVFGLDEDK